MVRAVADAAAKCYAAGVTSRIIHDDNIHAMNQLVDDGVRAKLLYMDPPFYSDADYFHTPRDGGPRVLAFTDRWPSLESQPQAPTCA